jgi:hypothetical protein
MDPFVAVAASPFREATLPGRQVGEGVSPAQDANSLLMFLTHLVVGDVCRDDDKLASIKTGYFGSVFCK